MRVAYDTVQMLRDYRMMGQILNAKLGMKKRKVARMSFAVRKELLDTAEKSR